MKTHSYIDHITHEYPFLEYLPLKPQHHPTDDLGKPKKPVHPDKQEPKRNPKHLDTEPFH